MANLFEREILEDSSATFFRTQPKETESRLASLKTALFLVFHQYYEDSEARDSHRSTAMMSLSILLSRGVVLFQLLGLLVLALSDRAEWDAYSWFLQGLSHSRFDQIAASFGALRLFFYLTASLVGYVCFALCFMLTRAYRGLSPNRFFVSDCFMWATWYLRGMGLVPSLCVLTATAKYSSILRQKMPEYWDTSPEEINLRAAGVITAISGLLGSLLILLHVMLVYEQFQSSSKWNLRAKAHALADLVVHFAVFMIVELLFVTDVYLSPKLSALVASIPAGIASAISIYYLPYYRLGQNLLWPSLFNIFIVAAISMLLSNLQHRPGVAVAVILFTPPVVVRLTKETMRMRWEFICANYTVDFNALTSHFQVELGTRAMIERAIEGDKSRVPDVIKAFNLSTGRFHAKMMYVWETNFYLATMQDPRVAMIKITKSQLAPSSLEADFRVFCFAKVIEKQHKKYEELEYLTFWYVFQEAKALDRESCHLLAAFWSELSSSMPRYPSLSRLVSQIAQTLKRCIEKNKAALKNYRTSKQALNLLGTLLKEILNDTKGDEYIARANLVQEGSSKSFFSEDGAVVVVSGEHSRLGEILFLSDKAKAILDIKNENEAIGMSISVFIPEPWGRQHVEYLRHFLLFSASSSVSHSLLHLVTTSGFLIEATAQIRVSYLHGSAFILIAFVESDRDREAILIENDERVLAHTMGVSGSAGLALGLHDGALLEMLFPGLKKTLSKVKLGEKFVYTSPRTKMKRKMRLVDEDYAAQKIRILYLLSDNEVKSTASIMQLSMSTLDPMTPVSVKKVGFDSPTSLEEIHSFKASLYADLEDPAFVRKRHEDLEVKVSITSSVASSSFLAASPYSQEDLQRVRSASFRLKASLLCMMCCMITISGICCGLVGSVVRYEFMADDFQVILRRGYYAARIATKIGQLQYIGDSSSVKSDLSTNIQLYDAAFNTMKDSVASWENSPAISYYTQNRVPTWDFWEGRATLHKRNLLDAIQTYLDHAKTILAGRPHTSDFLYVYRNGLGETFAALNITCRLHLAANTERLRKAGVSITVAIWCGQGALLLLYLLVVLPSIVLIARVHAQAWKRLLSLNRNTLLKLRNECHSRLEFHHNRDDRAVRPFEAQTQERRVSSFRNKWSGLTLKTSAYILLSTIFLGLLWQLLCEPVITLLHDSPLGLVQLEEENLLLQTILFWVQEMQWNATGNDMKLLYPRLWFSPSISLARDMQALKRNLAASLEGYVRSHTDFLFDTSAKSNATMLDFGLHAAISLLTIESSSEPYFFVLEQEITAAQTRIQAGIAEHISDLEVLIGRRVLLVVFFAMGYCALSLLLYLVVYVPMVDAFRKQVSEVWKLYRIIPPADLVENGPD